VSISLLFFEKSRKKVKKDNNFKTIKNVIRKEENNMNWKRFLLVLSLTIVVIILFDYMYNFLLLQKVFMENSQYWRPPGEMQHLAIFGWLLMLFCTTIIGLIFIRSGRTGIFNGLEFGFLIGLSFFSLIYGFTTIVPWPTSLLIAWAGQWFANNIILGFLFGWLYKNKDTSTKNGFS
jgi:hypothetical protein